MKKIPLPFQVGGAKFLVTNPHALLADEPGLGKTIQAISAVEQLGLKKILVVCPASMRLGWLQEVNECLGSSYGWQVISYNQAVKLAGCRDILAGAGYENRAWDAIILDEVHFLKTPESQRTQAIFGPNGLARRAKYKWCLTGTPVLNRPRELFPILKTLCPAFANMKFNRYADIYCGAFFDGRAINSKGASNLDDLANKLKGFMLRRTKADVLPELPPKRISRVPLEVTHAEFAEVHKEEEMIGNRESKVSSVHEDFSALGDMAHLLRLTGEAKVRAASDFIEDLLGSTQKVVVFAKHREVIKRLETRLTERGMRPVVYHGGMSDGQKKEAVDAFQFPECRVFIGQIAAAGTGINGLQNHCSTVVFAELSWVPGETGQAVDRCHRIGQKADSVNVYLLHVPGTLESAVLAVHDGKTQVIERLMQDDALAGLM